MSEEEQEMTSDSTLLYPVVAEPEEEAELPTESDGTRYLFPESEFQPDNNSPSTSTQPTNGEIIRNCIVQDMLSHLLRKVVPNIPSPPTNRPTPPIQLSQILTRDEIIKRAMEQAYRSRTSNQPLHTQPLLQNRNWNRKPKIPPIRVADDPELRELIQRGKSKGYSDAAMLKTRRDNQTRRLLIPSKEEAETVDVWRLEEQYRTSINKLKGYSL